MRRVFLSVAVLLFLAPQAARSQVKASGSFSLHGPISQYWKGRGVL